MSMDDFDDVEDELFNDDFDDTETTLRRSGIRSCSQCHGTDLGYKVDGRFVIRTCRDCGNEMEE